MKETLLEQTETISQIPENCDAAIFIGFIPRRKTQDGETLGLTEALIESARNSMGATLESVGAPSTIASIARLSTDALGDGETTRVVVKVAHEKISPDPIPDVDETELLEPEPATDGDETTSETGETEAEKL